MSRSTRSPRMADNPAFDRFRSLSARRALVLATALAIAGCAANLVIGGHGATSTAPFVLAGGGIWMVRRVVRLVADLDDAALDERLIAVRDAAYLNAYRLLAIATMLVLLVLYIAADAERWTYEVGPEVLQGLFWAFVGAAVLAPSAVVAWTARHV